MAYWNRYFTPASIDEAVGILRDYQGLAQVIAGGTDLMLDLQQGNHPPVEALVDITKIPALQGIQLENGTFSVGAGVTHAEIARHADIGRVASCLAESCGVVGGPQVRNVGTLGGNVAHALPAGDGTTSLVALNATVDVVYDGQRRTIPILEMFAGPGQSLLESNRDILLGFQFAAAQPGQGSAFERIMRPQGVALPILGCAVWVELDETRRNFNETRICIGPAAKTPIRARQTEAFLSGKPATEATIIEAASQALAELKPRTSKYRATAKYRQLMIDTLVRRTLPVAVQRAGGDA